MCKEQTLVQLFFMPSPSLPVKLVDHFSDVPNCVLLAAPRI